MTTPKKSASVRNGAVPRKVAITPRDSAVLSWLSHVKVAGTDSMRDAYKYFGDTPFSEPVLSRRLSALTQAGYLGSATMSRGAARKVYWPAGERYYVSRRSLLHDLTAARLSIHLLNAGSASILKYNRLAHADDAEKPRIWTQDLPAKAKMHHADGLLWLPNDRAAIIEVELSPKNITKLASVMDSHARRLADDSDPVEFILYLTTRRVGQMAAQAWRNFGHEADHPGRIQFIDSIDDTTLELRPVMVEIPVPDSATRAR